jgi:hypothetical protein
VKRVINTFVLFTALLVGAPKGEYAGTWTSDGGVNSGKVNISMSDSGSGDLSFTYQDQTVKPQKVTAKVTENQVEFVCELDLDGLKLKTIFQGTVDGAGMSGKYQSTSAADGSVLDSGTWKVKQS